MDQKLKISEILKKYTMIIALAVIIILFTVNTGGKMLLPQNVNNLIARMPMYLSWPPVCCSVS